VRRHVEWFDAGVVALERGRGGEGWWLPVGDGAADGLAERIDDWRVGRRGLHGGCNLGRRVERGVAVAQEDVKSFATLRETGSIRRRDCGALEGGARVWLLREHVLEEQDTGSGEDQE
jgi:hypothetical protein